VVSEPVTWLPFLPVVAAYSFLDAPGWICLGALGAVAAGVAIWWRSKWAALCGESRAAVLREICRADNAEIKESLLTLLKEISADTFGTNVEERNATVARLRNLPRKKEAIDEAIFADGEISPVETEVAVMVSDLCRALLADLRKLAGASLSASERSRLAGSVSAALKALDRAHTEIETLIEPAHGLGPSTGVSTAKERALRLEERLAEAKAIRRRLERDIAGSDVEVPPPPPESINHERQ